MVSYFSRLRRRRSRGIEGVLRAEGREGKGIKRSGIMTKPINRKWYLSPVFLYLGMLRWYLEVKGKQGVGIKGMA